MEQGNRTALITGASRGLGLALARGLAARGWALIITARDGERLGRAREELAGRTRVAALAGDVTDPGHREALAEAAREWGGVDALVNNAGVLGPSPQPGLLDYPLEILERVLAVNVLAPLGLVQAAWGALKPGGCVVNVTSDAAVEPYAGWGGYGASKAALEHISAVLQVENPDLRFYRVDPGDLRTDMHQAAYPGEDISDRPPPEERVPALVALLESGLPGGRYRLQELVATAEVG